MKLITTLLAFPFVLFAGPFAGPFEGTWKTNCSAEGSTNVRYTVLIGDRTAAVDQMQYKDNQCITPTILSKATGSVDFPNTDGAAKFDLTYSTFTVTLKDAATVKVANFMEFCGVSDWKLDVPTDVTGKTCGEGVTFPKVGDKHYNIVGLNEKSELLLGRITKELDGTTPEKRPTELQTEFPFIKQ